MIINDLGLGPPSGSLAGRVCYAFSFFPTAVLGEQLCLVRMCTIYLLKCQDRLKVGYTSQSFSQYLSWVRARIPFEVKPLMTRRGTKDEELEFHRTHRDFQCGFGGREWYDDTPLFRTEAERFFGIVPASVPFPEQLATDTEDNLPESNASSDL